MTLRLTRRVDWGGKARWMLVGCSLISALSTEALAQAATSTEPMRVSDSAPTPITLRAALERALSQYPSIAAAQARVQAARGSRVTAGALGNPVLSYEVDNTPFPGSASIPGLDREAMTTATLPLEPLYQRASRIRQANATVRAAEAEALATRQRVELDAATAFYRTAAAQVQWTAAQDLASWLDSVVSYNLVRVNQGATADVDLIRSQLERDRALADVAMAAADLARARADLGAFLGAGDAARLFGTVVAETSPLPLDVRASGANPDQPLAASSTLQSGAADSLATLQRMALDRRPDVRAARERVQSARAGVGTEHTMLFRQLGAMFGAKQTAGTTSMIAGVSVPLPLFDQNRGEIARASAERNAAQYELAAQEQSARADVAGAYEAARVLTTQAGALAQPGQQSYLDRADEARRIAFGAYREGAASLLQVLDAARAWEDARVAFYRVLYAQHESVLALRAAEGLDLITAIPFSLSATAPSNVSH